MLDIKFIRENPEKVKENIKKKFQNEKLKKVDEFLEKEKKYRELLQKSEKLRASRNKITHEINELKKQGKNISKVVKEAKELPDKIRKVEEGLNKVKKEIVEILYVIPNMVHKSVPVGKNDKDNVVKEVIGKPKKFDFNVKNHVEIAEKLGIADFETSAKTSGNGFYYLKGDLALLNMALINFSRDYMIGKGYEYVEPPLMIRGEILKGVFSNEEIEQMSYKVEDEDLFLIATSEHPMIGMFINKIINKEDLPIKLTGFSQCFRKEIGSHGIDQKGLFRTHQFNKQEMIVICEPEDSYKFYDEMQNHSKAIFKKLGLPIRELEICSGDLADLKSKSADLEVWSPRKKEYFEITSCTNMEAAQARRLNIRVTDGKEKWFAHTLNNTVIATSRAIVAILENYQNKDGSITIPKALVPYMNNKTKISAKE
ncbi:serine--tRNA ligase [Candidatus Woesearchaeota archaeon B3_Woes]|nr:MAG: serine--tRNA ligase [Candidatus Woesearchaeota archaeon B3_Woes]